MISKLNKYMSFKMLTPLLLRGFQKIDFLHGFYQWHTNGPKTAI